MRLSSENFAVFNIFFLASQQTREQCPLGVSLTWYSEALLLFLCWSQLSPQACQATCTVLPCTAPPLKSDHGHAQTTKSFSTQPQGTPAQVMKTSLGFALLWDFLPGRKRCNLCTQRFSFFPGHVFSSLLASQEDGIPSPARL